MESKPTDFNRSIYYKNKLEFSLETGWLPINIPFVFDFLLGGGYNQTGLKYTLVPTVASLRWQLDDLRGPSILRGNWDLSFSDSFTAIPRGPEMHYGAYDMGIRRNFVRSNWRIVPYFDGRLGMGLINAKGPKGGLHFDHRCRWTITFLARYVQKTSRHISGRPDIWSTTPKCLIFPPLARVQMHFDCQDCQLDASLRLGKQTATAWEP